MTEPSELEAYIDQALRARYRELMDTAADALIGDRPPRPTGLRGDARPLTFPITLEGVLDQLHRTLGVVRRAGHRPACVAANTATLRELAAQADPDSPPWRQQNPTRVFGIPVVVDETVADGVIEPRATYPEKAEENGDQAAWSRL